MCVIATYCFGCCFFFLILFCLCICLFYCVVIGVLVIVLLSEWESSSYSCCVTIWQFIIYKEAFRS